MLKAIELNNTLKSTVVEYLATYNENGYSLTKEHNWNKTENNIRRNIAKIVNHARRTGESSQALKIIQSAAVSSIEWLEEIMKAVSCECSGLFGYLGA